jgi:uncharacterized protein (TIGR03546 family)
MLALLLKPVRMLLTAFKQNDSHGQLAAGFVLGMLLGLLPKDNLFVAILSVLLLATHVNLGAAAVGTLIFSWLGVLTDPLTERLATALLTAPALRLTWTLLYNLPLAPWTHFNNTAVLGNLLLGGLLCYPMYRFAKYACDRWRPKLVELAVKHELVDLFTRAEKAFSWRFR